MNIGWIKLHRQFRNWEWYNKSEMVHLFIHCLIKANYENKMWQGENIEIGLFVTSLQKLSIDTGISVQTIRTCLKKLEKTNEIIVKSTNKLTKITICKYESYQLESETTNKQLTNNQQTTNKQLTTTKEYKENKKDKEEKNIPNFQSFLNHALTKEPNIDEVELKKKYDAWVNNNWHDGNGKKIIIWKTKLNSTIPYISKKQSKQEVDKQFFKITL
jgi:hypothetical protein